MKRKNLLSYFGLAVCVITAVLLLTIPSCHNGSEGTGFDPAEGMQNAIFEYSAHHSYFSINHVTAQGMGKEMYSGKFNLGYTPMTSFTMKDGRQFIFGHRESGYWFIQEILPTGDLGFETDSGFWNNYYETLSAWRAGDKVYIYGGKLFKDYSIPTYIVSERKPGFL